MKPFIKKPLFYAPIFVFFIGVPVAVILSKYIIVSKLNHGVKYRQFFIKTNNLRIEPTLCLKSDGLRFESPALNIISDEFIVQLKPFSSPVLRKPLLIAHLDSLHATVIKEDKSELPKGGKQTTGFPSINIPILMGFRVNSLILSRHGDTQFVNVHHLKGRNFSKRHFDVSFLKAGVSSYSSLQPGGEIKMKLGKKRAYLSAFFYTNEDSLFLNWEPDLADWQKFSGDFRIKSASVQELLPDIDFTKFGNPRAFDVKLNFQRDSCWSASGHAQIQTGDLAILPKSRLVLNPLNSHVEFNQRKGKLRASVEINGDAGEEAFFTFNSNTVNFQSLSDLKKWLGSLSGGINGYVQNFGWLLGKRNLPLDFEVVDGIISAQGFKGALITAGGSFIRSEMNWESKFRGSFHADLSPREKWVLAWHRSEDRFRFHSAAVSCEIEGPDLSLEARLKELQAYGALADSAIIHGRVLKKGYKQDSARIYLDDICWKVHGEVNWSLGNENLKFIMENPQYGKAVFAMPTFEKISAAVSGYNVAKSLYKPLRPIFAYEPVVTGLFQWDFENDIGKVDCQSVWHVLEQPVRIALTSSWTPKKFNIDQLHMLRFDQALKIQGKVDLHGKPFYEIYQTRLGDVDSIQLLSKNIELSPWISLLKDSLVNRAELNGQMGYSRKSGMFGQLNLDGVSFHARDSLFKFKSLGFRGYGKDIEINGELHSLQTAFLNDSISVRIADVLSSRPNVRVHVMADKTLSADFNGYIENWRKLMGELRIQGGIDLGGDAGQLGTVEALADVSVPLVKKAEENLNIQGQLKGAQYAYSDMEPIGVSSPFRLTAAGIEFPDVFLSSRNGRKMNGYGHYSFTSKSNTMVFHLLSPEMDLVLPGGHALTLYGMTADVQLDSDSLTVESKFGKGFYKLMDKAYNVESELLNTGFLFISKISGKHSLRHNFLGVNTSMRNFLFSNRNLGWRQFQNLFKKRAKVNKRKGRPIEFKLYVQTEGDSNRVDMDFVRFNFEGDVNVSGTYPFLLAKGELNSVKGEFGGSSQEYKLEELGVRWENESISEGAADMTAVKWLASSCESSEQEEKCSIEINLTGPLNKMDFSYGGTCADELGESIDPVVLLSSAGLGCYDPDMGSDIPIIMLEGQLSSLSSRQIRKWSKGWFKRTNISGFSHLLNPDDELPANSEDLGAVALEIETAEWQRLQLRAKSGYIPGSKTASPWKHEASVLWRLPLESLSDDPAWRHRLKKRFMVDMQAKSTPLETDALIEKHRDMQFQLGINYNYEFWDIW